MLSSSASSTVLFLFKKYLGVGCLGLQNRYIYVMYFMQLTYVVFTSLSLSLNFFGILTIVGIEVWLTLYIVVNTFSATVMSEFSGNWEGSRTLCSIYCTCLVFLASAYLSCSSLRGALGCVEMLTETITGSWYPPFLGR